MADELWIIRSRLGRFYIGPATRLSILIADCLKLSADLPSNAKRSLALVFRYPCLESVCFRLLKLPDRSVKLLRIRRSARRLSIRLPETLRRWIWRSIVSITAALIGPTFVLRIIHPEFLRW
jgi:hypothetical protein